MTEISILQRISTYLESTTLELPVFSQVALKLQRSVQNPEYDTRVLASLISRDAALTAEILKIANSPLYGGLVEIKTLQQAILRLGSDEIVRIALIASTGNYYQSKDRSTRELLVALWKKSVISAISAKWIADRLGHTTISHEAFVCGLIHDIGELYIILALEKMPNRPVILDSVRAEILRTYHGPLGFSLLKKWHLPEVFQTAAQAHHINDFTNASLLQVIVSLTDRVCELFSIGLDKDPELVLASTPEATYLGLTPIALAELEVKIEDLLTKA